MNLTALKNLFSILLTLAGVVSISLMGKNPKGVLQSVERLNTGQSGIDIESIIKTKTLTWEFYFPREDYLRTLIFDKNTLDLYRIKLENASPLDKDLLLELNFPHLMEVDFYLEDQGKILTHLKSGHTKTQNFLGNVSLNPFITFPFRIEAKRDVLIYVRIKNDAGISRTPFSVHDAGDYPSLVKKRFLVFGMFMGGLLFIALYNLFLFVSLKESSFLFHTLHLVFALYFFYIYNGMGYLYPFADKFHLAMDNLSYSFLVLHFWGAIFISRFLNLKELNKLSYLLYRISLAILLTASVVIYFLPTNLSIAISFLSGLPGYLIFMVSSMILMKTRFITCFYVAWTGVISANFILILNKLGVFPSNVISDNISHIGILWEAIWFSMALGDRIKRMQEEKTKIRQALSNGINRSKLNEVFGQVYRMNQDLLKREVCIVFLDISNFSAISKKLGSYKSFLSLSHLLSVINQIIIKYYGIVDRSLGDGVLAVFGAEGDFNNEKSYVDRAFMAAVDKRLTMKQACG
ncbi:MAG: hypothetical protein HQK54_10310, partial [Oligoflexales bacterium]|nr:hypothetical protein [Oligoflexales bacterium]